MFIRDKYGIVGAIQDHSRFCRGTQNYVGATNIALDSVGAADIALDYVGAADIDFDSIGGGSIFFYFLRAYAWNN